MMDLNWLSPQAGVSFSGRTLGAFFLGCNRPNQAACSQHGNRRICLYSKTNLASSDNYKVNYFGSKYSHATQCVGWLVHISTATYSRLNLAG